MREEPSAAELLDVVAEFLRDQVMPALPPHLSFHTRIAANVVDIVRRELAVAPGAVPAEAQRLAALLGHDGDPATLNAELCDRIGAGGIALDDPQLVRHLWATTLDTLAIDQPKYETYRRAAKVAAANNDMSDGER
jgi:hypothetical protein